MKYLSLFLLLISSLFLSCVKEGMKIPEDIVQVGDTIPFFEAYDDVSSFNTDELKGKISVITFFNTSCPDCQRELPQVQAAYENFKEDSLVRFIAISREEDFNSVSSYWNSNNLEIPFIAQNSRVVYNLFAKQGIPRVYISDPSLIVCAYFDDSSNFTSTDIIDLINSLK